MIKDTFEFSLRNCKNVYFGPEKRVVYVRLPYIGCLYSKRIRKVFRDLVHMHNLAVSLRFIFCNNNTVQSYFRFKDKYPYNMLSHVVYKGSCTDCDSFYLGKTQRLLITRVDEHKQALSKACRQSSIADHVLKTGHNFDFAVFKVLAHDNNDVNLAYLESLLISELRPPLNNSSASVHLNLFTSRV